MEWFKFNEFTSTDNLIIKEMPPLTSAKKNITSIKIDGRNGNLNIDEGTYESVDVTIECVVIDDTKIDAIKTALRGIGTIEFSTNQGRQYKAVVKNQISLKKYLEWVREFPLQLELDPISYSTTLTTLTKTANDTFTALGNIDVAPILEVKGSGAGTLVLNNKTITFSALSSTATIIDCDLMEAKQGGNNANALINCVEFPKISNSNTLTLTGISEVVIKYREGWL